MIIDVNYVLERLSIRQIESGGYYGTDITEQSNELGVTLQGLRKQISHWERSKDEFLSICLAPFYNHPITQSSTNLFLKRKALPKEYLSFSFSTGFLFVKKKKCCVNLVKSRGFLKL